MSLNHTSKFAELTNEQFQLIGKIVVEWANIEFLQKQILSRLLFSPEFISRTYTDRMSAVKVQESIKESIALHRNRYRANIVNEEILHEIERVNEEVHNARAHRNKFAHFCWFRSTDEEICGTNFSAGLPESKKGKKSFITINNTELNRLYKESYNLVDKINKLIDKLPEIEEETLTRITLTEQLGKADPKSRV
ncbi:hypothetical protein HRM2_39720 [Desulforapulum autotrophicum HRM2]|uniref:Uncharacterized protein n=1 Tax=Desulforapulum autotrophicum (strain ATCC 43914 / DSM 3382 / VKM B-1955 / HRM2) TaxID=177437 RepID=C0QBM8_DESAH|nr:hypothetical protein [Desulforapulum autotrophicum]ACN17030.1 hypothetical protein HRM2_39720 [Desulforapulum autotrophicum HRM2]